MDPRSHLRNRGGVSVVVRGLGAVVGVCLLSIACQSTLVVEIVRTETFTDLVSVVIERISTPRKTSDGEEREERKDRTYRVLIILRKAAMEVMHAHDDVCTACAYICDGDHGPGEGEKPLKRLKELTPRPIVPTMIISAECWCRRGMRVVPWYVMKLEIAHVSRIDLEGGARQGHTCQSSK
jgi:hypothetical protein